MVYRRLIERAPLNDIVNICSGKVYSLKEVVEITSLITHHNLNIRVNNNFFRTNEIKNLAGDPGKLISIIGVNKFFDIKETIHWMANNHV